MTDLTSQEPLAWGLGTPVPAPLRWLERLGPAFVRASQEGRAHDLPAVAAAVRFAGAASLQSWLLVEGWWRGVVDSDRVLQLLGEQPDQTLDLALLDLELAERVWDSLRPGEVDALARWGAEVLRGHGADGIVCVEQGALVLLGSTAGVRAPPPLADDDDEDRVMLSETEPPAREPDPPPPQPVKATRKLPKVPRCIRHHRGPQGALLDALGLRVGFVGLSRVFQVDSPTELRRQLLLDGLDEGVLTWGNLLLRFRGIGQELHPDDVREMLVDHADEIDVHPELAVLTTAPFRARMRAGGYDGIAFKRGTTDRIVLPHYYLRGFPSGSPLWRRICEGE